MRSRIEIEIYRLNWEHPPFLKSVKYKIITTETSKLLLDTMK